MLWRCCTLGELSSRIILLPLIFRLSPRMFRLPLYCIVLAPLPPKFLPPSLSKVMMRKAVINMFWKNLLLTVNLSRVNCLRPIACYITCVFQVSLLNRGLKTYAWYSRGATMLISQQMIVCWGIWLCLTLMMNSCVRNLRINIANWLLIAALKFVVLLNWQKRRHEPCQLFPPYLWLTLQRKRKNHHWFAAASRQTGKF